MTPYPLLRAVQSELPGAKAAKESVNRFVRRLARRPHEREFAIISRMTVGHQCLIDVGANVGQSIESMRLYAKDAALHAFEANINLARKLSHRYAGLDTVAVHSFGLGREAGERTLHVPTYRHMVYDGLASVDYDEAAGWLNRESLLGFRPQQLKIDSLNCEIRTLDSQDLDPAFIKIDVQGIELDVVLGGLKTIRRSEPVMLIEAPSQELVTLLADNGVLDIAMAGDQVRMGENHSGSGNRLFASECRRRDLNV